MAYGPSLNIIIIGVWYQYASGEAGAAIWYQYACGESGAMIRYQYAPDEVGVNVGTSMLLVELA